MIEIKESIAIDDIRRKYWRVVPLHRNIVCDNQFVEAVKGPGAFKVTVMEFWFQIHKFKKVARGNHD